MNKLLLTCLLLLFVSEMIKCDGDEQPAKSEQFKMVPQSSKVKCPAGYELYKGEDKMESVDVSDGNSGEYECRKDNDIKTIFIKFRSCDNCVELDVLSVTGLIFGEVLATLAIAISVHLLAKHARIGTSSSKKKGSDKQHLVPNEMSNDDNYQRLRFKNGRQIYDELGAS
ncbi:T-cell surface glycoprotein CD3 gamma chain-like [Periophthalmus magnuspinnatus]|uniref:T-cell surface glycoprotein CD3 gamma chain-like n=1 Tax=Periophthalmus magnuspinnatus TaxID=409849 RepID=UPI00145BF598|nr:T-cell surface glycoprotein CD3 gamma chain-like [Periophthalmus magnuspinnatus]